MRAVFFIYSKFRARIYASVGQDFLDRGYDVSFYVQDYATMNIIKSYGFKGMKLSLIKNNFREESDSIKTTIDYTAKIFNYKTCNQLYQSTFYIISNLKLDSKDIVFGGNGYHSQDLAIIDSKEEFRFRSCFTELSNMPGKVFFDPMGSNIRSKFHTLISSDLPSDIPNIDKTWLSNFVDEKNNNAVPQAKDKHLSSIFSELFCDLIYGYSSYNKLRLKSLSFNNLYNQICHTLFKNVLDNDKQMLLNLDSIDYLFFPFQVSNDSQILLNSKYDNFEALEYFNDIASQRSIDLVVKLHPAETNAAYLKKIYDYCSSKNIKISNNNTIELISKSRIVGVINSTVGLESILMDKEVIFMGESFYKKLVNRKWLSFYINHYLQDIDFFTGSKNKNLVEDILKII